MVFSEKQFINSVRDARELFRVKENAKLLVRLAVRLL